MREKDPVPNRKYTDEFKGKAVRLGLSPDLSGRRSATALQHLQCIAPLAKHSSFPCTYDQVRFHWSMHWLGGAMRVLASGVALIIAGLGALGVASPSFLLDLVRPLLSPVPLYVVATVRVAFGVVLWIAASGSRMPRTLRTLGFIIVAAGLLTPFFGAERSRAVFDWWTQQPLWFMRSWAMLPIILGAFIFWAVRPREQAAA